MADDVDDDFCHPINPHLIAEVTRLEEDFGAPYFTIHAFVWKAERLAKEKYSTIREQLTCMMQENAGPEVSVEEIAEVADELLQRLREFRVNVMGPTYLGRRAYKRWLRQPCAALDGAIPQDLLVSSAGVEEVMRVINRIGDEQERR